MPEKTEFDTELDIVPPDEPPELSIMSPESGGERRRLLCSKCHEVLRFIHEEDNNGYYNLVEIGCGCDATEWTTKTELVEDG